jgi:hypothetical protein
MEPCVQTHRHKTVTVESQTTVIQQESPVYQDCSLTGRVQEPSIHRVSFTHFTLVLESIHTCQGREHSRSKRRVETSAVRSTPTHKTAHQSQYSVHDSLLHQLLKTNCMISSSTVFQVRFWCRFCMWGCVQTHRHKPVTVESQTTVFHIPNLQRPSGPPDHHRGLLYHRIRGSGPLLLYLSLLSYPKLVPQHLRRFPAPISGNLYSKWYFPVMGAAAPFHN